MRAVRGEVVAGQLGMTGVVMGLRTEPIVANMLTLTDNVVPDFTLQHVGDPATGGLRWEW